MSETKVVPVTSGNVVVDRFGKMAFEGHIIPHSWHKNIRKENGRPDPIAVLILADIVYWYRPGKRDDEQTGAVTWYKKFEADKLQRSYGQLSESLGFTKRQITDACHRLEQTGLITLELRTLTLEKRGLVLHNVLYIEPVPDEIERITYATIIHADDKPGDASPEKTGHLPRKNGTPPPPNEDTYTKSSPQTSAQSDGNMSASTLTEAEAPPAESEGIRDKQKTIRKAVSGHFREVTHLKPPARGSKAMMAKLWWNPISEICELSEWDEEGACSLVSDAVKELSGLTISDPNSILKTARALKARNAGGYGAKPKKQTIKIREADGTIRTIEAMI